MEDRISQLEADMNQLLRPGLLPLLSYTSPRHAFLLQCEFEVDLVWETTHSGPIVRAAAEGGHDSCTLYLGDSKGDRQKAAAIAVCQVVRQLLQRGKNG